MRLARTRLHDESRAEDAVQETLLAVLRGTSRFQGRSGYRTWLTGILLHKIHDSIRLAARERSLFASAIAESGDVVDDGFDEAGAWLDPSGERSDPERARVSKQLRAAFTEGLSKLPSRQAQAFVLREVAGMEGPDICRTLGITSNNLFVLLHRARLNLRVALERTGFASANAVSTR